MIPGAQPGMSLFGGSLTAATSASGSASAGGNAISSPGFANATGGSFSSMFSELAATANGTAGLASGQAGMGVAGLTGGSFGAGLATGPGAGLGTGLGTGLATTGLATGLVSGLGAVAPAGATPFADLATESVRQVDKLERTARSSIEGLISGKGVDVHEAMIATEKAEMGFEMVLSVRDKALAAYQQVMGMQF